MEKARIISGLNLCYGLTIVRRPKGKKPICYHQRFFYNPPLMTQKATLAAVSASVNRTPMAMVQWLVFVVCFILSMLEGFDVLAISYASVAISEQLSLSPDQLGLLISAALLGMTIGALFLAMLSDIFGRRTMILVALLLSGTGMYVTGLSQSLWLILLCRLVTGLGIGILLATVATLVAEFMPERHRSMAVGAATAGYAVGASIGGLVAVPLIQTYGWPSIFFSGGVLTLLMALIVRVFLPESLQFLVLLKPKGALKAINRTLRRLGHASMTELDAQAVRVRRPGPGVLLNQSLRRHTTWLWSSFALAFASLYFLFGWIPKLVADSSLSQTTGIYALTFFNLGALAGVIGLGRLAAFAGLGRVIALFMLAGAAAIAAFPFMEGAALLALCVLLGILVQGGFVGLYAAAAAVYPAEVRATGVGWGIGLGRIGAVASPYVTGLLIGQNVPPLVLFVMFALILALAGLCANRIGV